MAKGVTVHVEGLRELDQALGEMSRATAKNVAKRTLLKAGEPIAAYARQYTPVDRGVLKRSITVQVIKSDNSAGKAAFSSAMKLGASRSEAGAAMAAATGRKDSVEVAIGPGRLPYAHMVEFGTVDTPVQAFMRPAWDAGKDRALTDIKDGLSAEIAKAAARAARKAARLAAKG